MSNIRVTPIAAQQVPAEVRCARDYEWLAQRCMRAASYEYIAGGSGDDTTVTANSAAFAGLSVCPRVLRDVTAGHTRLTLHGQTLAHPVLLAPVAFQKLAHPQGEIETARAAHVTESCLVTSTLASCSLEEIASAAGPQRWFQLYLQARREDTCTLLRRAAAAGYGAIVLTVDAGVQQPSLRALRAGFRMPEQCVAANLADQARVEPPRHDGSHSRIFQLMHCAPTWAELEWLLTQTSLPVWVKGVLHADDAVRLRALGVAGVVVSNHGGRSVDGTVASLQALPAIRAAVSPSYPLLFDGGIRSGMDIFKALARGADAVLVGRLQVYALAVAGALGVAHMIRSLREELELCMAANGCATLQDVRRATLSGGRDADHD
jgi:4-hydroxymandelate oxidase